MFTGVRILTQYSYILKKIEQLNSLRASTAPQTSEIVVDNFVVVYDKKASTNIILVRDGSRRQQKRPVLYVEFPSFRMQAVSFSIV